MKKLVLFLFTAIIILSSCSSSKESKAKKLIEEHFKNSMNDWSSYEFVKMTDLDSTFSTFIGSEKGSKMWDKKTDIELNESILQIEAEYETDPERKILLLDSIKKGNDYLLEYLQAEKEFKPKHDGWYTDFSCRGKNKLGALILNKYRFYFDLNVEKIIQISDLE